MALVLGGPNIPFVPPEIHLVIAQHVCRSDLPNYRLVSRLFAEAGKAELFHTITLRRTCASVSQLKQITQHEQLAKLVYTLIWDTNRWRVGVDVRDWHEWTSYCKSRAHEADPGQSALYEELATSRQHWEAYLSRLEDEKQAAKGFEKLCLSTPFARLGLLNLQEIHVVRGAYQLNNWHVCMTEDNVTVPVTVPLDVWKGDSLSRFSCDLYMATILLAVKRWRLSGITIDEFARLRIYPSSHGVDPNSPASRSPASPFFHLSRPVA
ncbi:hypothetical protein M3J09_001884 [Ascochyta lentis]